MHSLISLFIYMHAYMCKCIHLSIQMQMQKSCRSDILQLNKIDVISLNVRSQLIGKWMGYYDVHAFPMTVST